MDGQERTPFEQLAQDARRDFYMSKDGQYTPEQCEKLLDNLRDWRAAHPGPGGKLQSWQQIANRIGLSASTLAELLGGKYEGDVDRQLRLADQFLALEAERRGRLDAREFCNIGLAKLMRGTVATGIKNNSCPVVIGPPGCGKSMFARALAATLETALFIRVRETKGTAHGVIELLYEQLPPRYREDAAGRGTRSRRERAVLDYLSTHRSTVIIVDECQKLRGGLEMLRDFHDLSDLDARTNIPVCFFGDAKFYKHLVSSRARQRSVIAPQLSRRLYPIFDVEKDGVDEGGNAYSVEDLVRVLKNDRLKLVSADGLRWLTTLANLPDYGLLGFAVAVAQMAWNLARPQTVTVAHLQRALKLHLGPGMAEQADTQTGGELLRKAAG